MITFELREGEFLLIPIHHFFLSYLTLIPTTLSFRDFRQSHEVVSVVFK